MNELTQKFDTWIKENRYKLRELTAITGIDVATLSNLRKGARDFTVHYIMKLAQVNEFPKKEFLDLMYGNTNENEIEQDQQPQLQQKNELVKTAIIINGIEIPNAVSDKEKIIALGHELISLQKSYESLVDKVANVLHKVESNCINIAEEQQGATTGSAEMKNVKERSPSAIVPHRR